MNTQVNVRMPSELLHAAEHRTKAQGYGSVQEFIREAVREKVDGSELTAEEIVLVKRLATALKRRKSYGTEGELLRKLG